MRTLLLYTLLAVALAPPASAKKNDIDADKSKRRVVTDPMDPSDCKLIYKAAGGRYFPRATHDPRTYKPEQCNQPGFFNGKLPNADKSKPGFDRLPICLGMREHIDHYLQQYPNKCRRLTSASWSQELNQLFIWCIGTGHLKGGAIWLASNAMMSKGWVDKKLNGSLANDGDEVFVTASEACFWNDVLGKPFPLSGKEKAKQKAETKSKKGGK